MASTTVLRILTTSGHVLIGPKPLQRDYRVEDLKLMFSTALALLGRDDVRLYRDGRALEQHETIAPCIPAPCEEGEQVVETIDLIATNESVACQSPTCTEGVLARCPLCGRWREGPCNVKDVPMPPIRHIPEVKVVMPNVVGAGEIPAPEGTNGNSDGAWPPGRRKRLKNVALPAPGNRQPQPEGSPAPM